MSKEMTKEQFNEMRWEYIEKLSAMATFRIVDMWNEYAEAYHLEHIYEELSEVVGLFNTVMGLADALLGGDVRREDQFFYLDDGYIKSFTHYVERTSPIYVPAMVDWQIENNHENWLEFVENWKDE